MQPQPARDQDDGPVPDGRADAIPPDDQSTLSTRAPVAGRVPSARLIALFEVILCSGFPTQLAIARILTLAGLSPYAGNRYSSTFIFTLSLTDAVVLVGLVLWLLRRHGESPRAVLFGPRPIAREAVVGIALIPIVFLLAAVVLILVQVFAPWLHNVRQNPLEILMKSRVNIALFAVVAIVSGGVREEVQRAFLLHRFEQHLGGGIVGLVVFSVIFGAGHIIQGLDAALATAALGAFWGAIYLIRRSIAAPLVSHAGFDLAQIIRYTLYGL